MSFSKSLLIAVMALASLGAQAQGKYNGEDRGRPVQPAQVNATWQQECAGCHMAFGPGLLPALSWQQMMAGLDKHFGVDASLTPAQTTEITDFLVKNASNRWTAKTSPARITESGWFKAKHLSGEIAPAVWKRESIKSASNCQACHAGADKGNFDERSIKIPK
jgi:mono/diheme cytochrome c family protein